MTLAEFQPYVEAAVTAHEWATARARWRRGLVDEAHALTKAVANLESMVRDYPEFAYDRAPYDARLAQIDQELAQDVTPDRVSAHPIRSIPMDMIATAVIRKILRLPAEFPVLSIKTVPDDAALREAVNEIALRWYSPNGAVVDESAH